MAVPVFENSMILCKCYISIANPSAENNSKFNLEGSMSTNTPQTIPKMELLPLEQHNRSEKMIIKARTACAHQIAISLLAQSHLKCNIIVCK